MKFSYPTSLSLVLLFSCSTRVAYMGNHYPATQQVDFFVDASAIKRPYTVVGRGYVTRQLGNPVVSKIQSKAIAAAKQNGADAVLVQDYYLPAEGSRTLLHTDSISNRAISLGYSSSPSEASQNFRVLFLKYASN